MLIGRILKDEETLAQHGVLTGNVLHLVKGARAGQPTDTPAATTSVAPAAVPAQVVPGVAPGGAPPPSGNMGGFGGMMNDPMMMQQAMGQMPGMNAFGGGMSGMDPAMMNSLMQSPVFSQMLEAMSQNPQMMAQMLQANPQVQQMAAQNPQMAMLLQNPQLLASLMNPQTMNAMMQMQQAMGSGIGGGMGGGQPPAMGTGQPNYAAMMAAMQNNPMFGQMLAGGGAAGGAMPLPPAALAEFEQRYVSEIAQLEGMGFVDRAANIEALRVCDGNVELAINYLFDLGAGGN